MLQKIYGAPQDALETRYSSAVCMGARKAIISGNPDHSHVSTSYVERQNLTMRMSMRRFTRLTNGFSKKLENHEHAVALYFMYYNFARIHQTLRVTPAMEAGISDHVWPIEEMCQLLPASKPPIAQIDRALARIDDGTYGVCESCGNAIGKMRLMAFPRATLCLTCKQREERR